MKKTTWHLPLLLAALAVPIFKAPAQNAAETPAEPEAAPILKKCTEYLAKADHFSVFIRTGYDVVQESGQKIEFGETRKITVNRPDHIRIEVERSDGQKGLTIYDGKDLTIYMVNQNVYAVDSKPGTIDDAIKYAVNDLHIQVPLAMMMMTTLPDELESRIDSVDYVEKTTIGDAPCDHLAVRLNTGVDFQIWIAQGDQPLPRRIVITYIQEKGQPQFWADFSDWNLAPDISDALFVFTPPDGAERIQFLNQVHNVIVTKPAPKTKKGGKKQ